MKRRCCCLPTDRVLTPSYRRGGQDTLSQRHSPQAPGSKPPRWRSGCSEGSLLSSGSSSNWSPFQRQTDPWLALHVSEASDGSHAHVWDHSLGPGCPDVAAHQGPQGAFRRLRSGSSSSHTALGWALSIEGLQSSPGGSVTRPSLRSLAEGHGSQPQHPTLLRGDRELIPWAPFSLLHIV